jgi:putative Holliday junction resolvase
VAVIELASLPGALPRGAPVLGLDDGERRLGVAISDRFLSLASPLTTIAKTKFTQDAQALFELMAQREAAGLVIGLPVNMDGSEGPRCQSVRAFARNLLRLRDIPVAFWDERLSTAAVTRVLIEQGDVSRARRAVLVDRMAAAWILQGALDRLRGAQPPPTTAL